MSTDLDRRRCRRCQPRLEPLEARLAQTVLDGPAVLLGDPVAPPEVPAAELSLAPEPSPGHPGTVLAVPAPGSVLDLSPEALVLSLSRPIDADRLGADVILARLDVDGAEAWQGAFGPGILDPFGFSLAVPLEGPLEPGLYRVLVAADSVLADSDGNPPGADGQPLFLGEFVVAGAASEGPMDAFTVTLAGPAPDAIPASSPEALVLAFSRPIDSHTLDAALVLETLDVDGYVVGRELLDPGILDLSATVLTVPLGRVLDPGRYRVLVAADAKLTDRDGTPLVTDGTPLFVADFRVDIAPGATLDAANDLGTLVGGRVVAASGGLDFRSAPHAVALYKVTVLEGAFWRLGLEVSAQRDGGDLDAALVLFDDRGRPLATAEIGRPHAEFDPYLFAGVVPGAYYIGVSGQGDRPGSPGGYDLAAGLAGTIAQGQPGGGFILRIVADPIAAPVRVLDFTVDRSDPRDPSPTGLTLGFSGVIRTDSAHEDPLGGLDQAIEVVDQGGRTWPVLAVRSDESAARISFVFGRRLPEGLYTVRLPGSGGLVDLAGLAPVAPDLPAGVLATFAVAAPATTAAVDPTDLGALLPEEALEGIALAGELSPGETIEYRVVITLPESYGLEGLYTGAVLDVVLVGPDGPIAIVPKEPGSFSIASSVFLSPAPYVLRLSATGPAPVAYQLTFRLPAITSEHIVADGLGQGPALNLRLVAPTVTGRPSARSALSMAPRPDPPSASEVSPRFPAEAPSMDVAAIPHDPPPTVAPPIPSVPIQAIPQPPLSVPTTSASPSGSLAGGPVEVADSAATGTAAVTPRGANTGLFLGLGSDFVGRPLPGGRIVASATASTVPSRPAVAPGPGQGLLDARVGTGRERYLSGQVLPGNDAELAAEPVVAEASATPPTEDVAPKGVPQLATDWLGSLAAAFSGWMRADLEEAPSVAEGPGASLGAPGIVDRAVADLGPAEVVGSDLVMVACVGLVTAVATRSRRRIDRTLRRLLGRSTPGPRRVGAKGAFVLQPIESRGDR